MLRTTALTLLLLCLAAPVRAAAPCDLVALQRLAHAPLTGLRKVERQLARSQSTEGGVWHLYFQTNGTLRRIVQTNYGETGRNDIDVTFRTRRAFVITERAIQYREPLFSSTDAVEARLESTSFFFCDGTIYPPLLGPAYEAASRLRAVTLRDQIFSAPEIADAISKVPQR
jgi:hypothetical protein